MYLAGDFGSILFGNAYMNSSHAKAKVYTYRDVGDDVAHHNNVGGSKTYLLDQDVNNGRVQFQDPSDTGFTIAGNRITAGKYTYRITIESHEDGENDKIYFHFGTSTGAALASKTWDISAIGFTSDEVVFDDVGFFVRDEGVSDVTINAARAYAYSRSDTPEVTPDIPEPSAFGMLAGLGSLALVAARRRRSRS